MWCVMQVKDGGEGAAEAFVSKLLPKDMNARCFHLTRSRKKKYGGRWRTVQENLLPGYVFIDTDRPEEVQRALKRSMAWGLLFSSDVFVSTLKEDELNFMESIINEDGRITLSNVILTSNGQICCISGPLQNVSHLIRKMDLHKRIAEVETSFLGKRHVLYLGIEIEGGAHA